jgi:hypothetical protein
MGVLTLPRWDKNCPSMCPQCPGALGLPRWEPILCHVCPSQAPSPCLLLKTADHPLCLLSHTLLKGAWQVQGDLPVLAGGR